MDYFSVFIFTSSIKLFLIPAYHSTDFYVHINWLRITHNLHLKDWYYDNLSIWTLDYPPFFAYYQLFLSYLSNFFDNQINQIVNEEYQSYNCILFLRLSVIFSEFIYAYSLYYYCKQEKKQNCIMSLFFLVFLTLLMFQQIIFIFNIMDFYKDYQF
ncbi:hypothetical protein IMG5_042060 [Ichthyophthirius multifiliis]|uniref:Alpha-1,3-glucosyltransferase n=1 Tax=Ichthyophthirius multifiliis TaxID=5932 RepID=G0QM26_ICHMU|nr:hypothetical protein IMG5_042060 [Ichthyophthirius multifiliis]EGR33730.1 hypothetical protein IMG5_042060 [Ichthyophthirius multifiliis]|eukprot:XP_004037716.1 hypothetical protein IMG5_042060 [Ichthyophthirius multifiliis]